MQRPDGGDHQDELGEGLAELASADEGGEAACLAHLVCPECGVVLDGSPHRPDCSAPGSTTRTQARSAGA